MFKASNNEAKYESLITGIKLYYTVEADSIEAYSDSQLVVNKLNGDYEVKDKTMAAVRRVCEATGILK